MSADHITLVEPVDNPATLPAAAPPPASRRPRWPWLAAIAVMLAAATWAWLGYGPWRAAETELGPDLSPQALDRRLLDSEQALIGLKRSHQSADQRLSDTRARTDLLRDEVLAVSQRSAILEDNLRELANATRQSRDVLRLDEAELLLGLAQTRLSVAGDLKGAIHASALAEQALAALTDPQWVNLRQTLAEELATLRHLPTDPVLRGRQQLDKLEAALPGLAQPSAPTSESAPARTGLQRLLDALIQVRASGAQDLLAPSERNAGQAALDLELALARGALEHRDEVRFRASLARIGHWLERLYADGPALRQQHKRLLELTGLALTPDWPALGRTLSQLRELRRPMRTLP